MKQRVKLAQALVHDPDLLLLDEPTNGLDPDGREEMLALIRDVAARREMSLILCSHLLRDVETVCERVIVLKQGEVAAAGRIAELTGPRRVDLRRAREGRRGRVPDRPQGHGLRRGGGARTAIRIFMNDGAGPELIFRVARECGVQVRYLRPGVENLEDVFLRALGTRERKLDARLRADLPPLRGARAAAHGPLLADHARGAAAAPVASGRSWASLVLAWLPFMGFADLHLGAHAVRPGRRRA